MERRLAVIMMTDIVGYSRLMGLDETRTIARQKAHRESIIDPNITARGGRIVKSTGDGVLVEFTSAVDAVECAVKLQETIAESEADVPTDQRIEYRIGINLGDIVIDGDDILGDGQLSPGAVFDHLFLICGDIVLHRVVCTFHLLCHHQGDCVKRPFTRVAHTQPAGRRVNLPIVDREHHLLRDTRAGGGPDHHIEVGLGILTGLSRFNKGTQKWLPEGANGQD